MDEDIELNGTIETGKVNPRPSVLTLLCLFFYVYFGLLTLLFFAGLINSGWITLVTNQYISTESCTKSQIWLLFGAGFLLHGLSFTGIVLMWNLRKAGYYFLGISCLAIATYQLINPLTAITSTAIYIIIIIFFGIFYKRMH